MLKMRITDGVREYYAIEHGCIPSLSVTLKPGVKIAVTNVRVEKGLMLLNSTNTTVLGGSCYNACFNKQLFMRCTLNFSLRDTSALAHGHIPLINTPFYYSHNQ